MTKKVKYLFLHTIVLFAVLFAQKGYTQISTVPDTSKMTYNQFSKQAGLYVFPTKGQTKQQQKKDEFESYKWAVEQTGYDPVNPIVVKSDTVKSGNNGTVVKKTVVGTAIGSISGNAGRGAAIGAASGIIQKKTMEAKQQQQAQQAAQQKQQALVNNYNKAFTASMEGRGYTVK